MRILIACEFSGIVRDAFLKRGHDAMSCDLVDSERPGPHYKGDVFDIIDDGWDMMIAHPPCTYISNAGVRWLHRDWGRWILLDAAVEFFMRLYESNIPMICIENPVPHRYASLPDYHQVIHPWEHGHKMTKKTCLWLKGLPPLMATRIMIDHGEMYRGKGKKTCAKWYSTVKMVNGKRSRNRSRTFPGIALAMAEQWG